MLFFIDKTKYLCYSDFDLERHMRPVMIVTLERNVSLLQQILKDRLEAYYASWILICWNQDLELLLGEALLFGQEEGVEWFDELRKSGDIAWFDLVLQKLYSQICHFFVENEYSTEAVLSIQESDLLPLLFISWAHGALRKGDVDLFTATTEVEVGLNAFLVDYYDKLAALS